MPPWQIKVSQWVARSNKFKTTGMDYDPNGNIQAMKRFNGLELPQHDFVYHYDPTLKNRLKSVENYTSEYAYDAIGRMTVEKKEDGDEQYVDYDVSGKVIAVYWKASKTPVDLKVQYHWDDRGLRLTKIAYAKEEETAHTTWYIRDVSGTIISIYEQNGVPENQPGNVVTAMQTEIPLYGSGKLGRYYPQQEGINDYELTDHLGNVWALVRDNLVTYNCTMEDNNPEGELEISVDNPRLEEMQYFENLFSSEQKKIGSVVKSYYSIAGNAGSELCRLSEQQ